MDEGAKAPVKPLLFLDVDGVLNCIGRHQGDYDFHYCDRIPVYVPPGTRERVARLAEVFEPMWATAWLGRAHSAWRDVLSLGDTPWPWLDWHDLKLPHVLRAAGDRPWAFVDDDAEWELRRLEWTRDHVAGLIVAPDSEVGLTDDHVDELLTWASRLGPKAPERAVSSPIDSSRPSSSGGGQ